MKFNKLLVFIAVFFTATLFSQSNKVYRAERDKVHNLVHTKLKVDFNFQEKEMNGEEWVTLTPHFYETDKVTLDAKAMVIHKVTMNNQPLEYNYDDYELIINLPRTYKRNEEFTLYIKYTARPEKVKQKGSAAITSAKGLYFIE